MKEKPAYHFQKAPYLGFVAENNNCHLHLHRQAELSYIARGEHMFHIDQECYHLKKGDLILVFPNQLHKPETKNYCKEITCVFDAALISDFTYQLTEFHLDQCTFRREELAPSTLEAIGELARTGISKSYRQHAIPFLEKGYLTVILEDLFQKRRLIPFDPVSPSYVISRFFNYIETHLDGDLSIAAIAGSLHMSPSRLSACITEYTGKTPHALVISRRLDRARPLLYKTDLSISEIARMTGFSSERSFYRNFKEMYQKSPIEFRNKKRAQRRNL